MKRRFLLACLACLTCAACSSGNEKPLVPDDGTKMHQLQTTVDKIRSDPNSSPELKGMATGISRQLDSDEQVQQFTK